MVNAMWIRSYVRRAAHTAGMTFTPSIRAEDACRIREKRTEWAVDVGDWDLARASACESLGWLAADYLHRYLDLPVLTDEVPKFPPMDEGPGMGVDLYDFWLAKARDSVAANVVAHYPNVDHADVMEALLQFDPRWETQ